MSPAQALKNHGKRIAKLAAKVKSEQAISKLFSQMGPSAAPLDLGDDCATILRTAWDARRNLMQEFTETDIVRLCAAFRGIGKNGQAT